MSGSGGQRPPPLDERARADAKVVQSIGEKVFEDNTRILRSLAWRGARAFIVCGVGVACFAYAMGRRRQEALEAEEDPTRRYLEEMRGLGFDVDTLEEELSTERVAERGS
ncbi:hypothetical protein ERJ75_000775600 [Trypanosoma vivax]|nr:hypothetical protein ERJ75_000775600 [Trypanosoma vivax]